MKSLDEFNSRLVSGDARGKGSPVAERHRSEGDAVAMPYIRGELGAGGELETRQRTGDGGGRCVHGGLAG
jgi:hypothetical protein